MTNLAQIWHPSSPEYGMQRSNMGSIRLALQHLLNKEATGYVLHPSIERNPGMRIADIGTGTGIWLLDLSLKMPDCHFDGWDISDEQFPPKETLPDNVRFGTFDARQIPEELKGKYDVVHAGYLFTLIEDGDPGLWIENLKSLLKPGGWIQWIEPDIPLVVEQSRKFEVDEAYPKLQGVIEWVKNVPGSEISMKNTAWLSTLDEHFKKHGLQNAERKIHEMDRRYSRSLVDYFLLTLQELGVSSGNKDLVALAIDAEQDVKKGGFIPTLTALVAIGRKL